MASNGAKTKSKKKRPMMRSKSAQKSARKHASRPKSTGHKVLTRPRSTRKQPGRPPKKDLPNLRPDESRPSKRGKWRPESEWDSESESESELWFGSSALRALRKKPVSKSRVSREAPRSSRSVRKSGKSGGTKSMGPMGASKKKSNARKHTEGTRSMKARSRGPSKAVTPPKRKKVA
jgi:hypothetical protein